MHVIAAPRPYYQDRIMSAKDRKKNRKKTTTPSKKDGGRPKKEPTAQASSAYPSAPVIGFPGHLKFPSNDFLRNESPHEESFQKALETSYLGLFVDPPSLIEQKYATAEGKSLAGHSQPPLALTLQEMNRLEYFQADVTQPFGLGTKCAKTYVTRCLVGDPGTTYKYLGLRMFAYSWKMDDNGNKASKNSTSNHLCQEIGSFQKKILVPRTQHHLEELKQKRQQQSNNGIQHSNYPISRSEAAYNICLINRMDSSNQDYKMEPFMERDKIAVAWHADSSLQHYSNIAVYQLILPSSADDNDDNKNNNIAAANENDWSLAVRVVPHAEGPHIQADHTPDSTIPALSFSLPSASAYYMCDDFNHHHQHAVLRNNNEGKEKSNSSSSPASIRYSCTYRLLRPSHTVQEVLEQCRKVCAGFHKRGPKIWRSEQLLLYHIESEWLRQFYIQGQHHYDMLFSRGTWDEPITQLWKYWAQLETRTRQTIELLQLAAQGKTISSATSTSATSTTPVPSKAERKKRDKQRKAYATVQELLTRSSITDINKAGTDDAMAFEVLYKPLVEQLQERATMRGLWKKREKDHVFMTMEARYRPLPLPVQYNSDLSSAAAGKGVDKMGIANGSSIMAVSPLPEDLQPVADRLLAFGKAYQSGNGYGLPIIAAISETDAEEKNATSPNKAVAATKTAHQEQQSKRKTKRNKKRSKQKDQPADATAKKKKRRY